MGIRIDPEATPQTCSPFYAIPVLVELLLRIEALKAVWFSLQAIKPCNVEDQRMLKKTYSFLEGFIV